MQSPHHYVYILNSLIDRGRHYVGYAKDLRTRLQAHNNSQSAHTSKHRPWQIETAISVRCPQKAHAFERYLKTAQVAHLPNDTFNW